MAFRLTLTPEVEARVVQTCINGVLPSDEHVTVARMRPWAILETRVHWQNLEVDCIYFNEAEEDAVKWQETTATTAFAKSMKWIILNEINCKKLEFYNIV